MKDPIVRKPPAGIAGAQSLASSPPPKAEPAPVQYEYQMLGVPAEEGRSVGLNIQGTQGWRFVHAEPGRGPDGTPGLMVLMERERRTG